MIFFTIIFSPSSFAQSEITNDSIQVDKNGSWFGLPLVFFSPETDWAFGAAGVYNWRIKKGEEANDPSQLQLGFAYTLNKQFLAYLPFQLNWKNNTNRLYGELGYYKYSYFFFGIGNDQIDTEGELFGVDYPRIRINALRKIKPNLYVGLQYAMDWSTITFTEENGLLESNNTIGVEGGPISGLGLVANYDSRDFLFNPTKGWFVETGFTPFSKVFGSDYEYTKLRIDAAYYKSFGKHTLAFNAIGEFNNGDAPFNQMALMGGNKRQRGFYEGRYRDNQMLVFQAEYRLPLFWKLGMVVFGGVGQVAPDINGFDLSGFKYTVGTGLRVMLLKEDRINLRVDVGWGQFEPSPEFYITVGEAF